jgi:hypothetical protein
MMSDSYDNIDKPFDFVEEEGKTALMCEPDPMLLKAVKPVLGRSGIPYHGSQEQSGCIEKPCVTTVMISSWSTNSFDTNDPDANGVLIYLERLNMAIRRNIFAVI